MEMVDEIDRAIYDRASYLKSYKDSNVVPLHFRSVQDQFDEKSSLSLVGNLAGPISSNRQSMSINLASTSGPGSLPAHVAESTHSASSIGHKSNRSVQISINNIATKSISKINNEDPALTMIKNLLQ
jgi:hypothetical protein